MASLRRETRDCSTLRERYRAGAARRAARRSSFLPHKYLIGMDKRLKLARFGSDPFICCAFVRAPQNFLFPVLALSPVFRAIFLRTLEALRAVGTLAGGPPELADDGDWK
jgi:hypothetical protein